MPGVRHAPLPALSPRNARVVRLGRLARQRRLRTVEGVFVLDGPTLLTDAVRAGLVVEEVFVEPGADERPEVAAAVAAAVEVGADAWLLTGGLRGHVEPTTPNGVAAVARIPTPAPPDLGPAEGDDAPLHLVLVGVADPGNVGTLLRTAEAVGASSVVLTDGSVDPWAPKVVRASAGSVLRVPVRTGEARVELEGLAAHGVRRVGTAGTRGRAPDQLDLTEPVALVLGSEAHGLGDSLADAIDAWASLPMAGEVESLNVAVAGSVLAFEVVRQRAVASLAARSDVGPA